MVITYFNNFITSLIKIKNAQDKLMGTREDSETNIIIIVMINKVYSLHAVIVILFIQNYLYIPAPLVTEFEKALSLNAWYGQQWCTYMHAFCI